MTAVTWEDYTPRVYPPAWQHFGEWCRANGYEDVADPRADTPLDRLQDALDEYAPPWWEEACKHQQLLPFVEG